MADTSYSTARAIIDLSNHPPSKSSLLKIIGNVFITSMVETLAEGHVLAEKTGLGVDMLHQFIEQMFPGPYVQYSTRMLSGDYYKREQVIFPCYVYDFSNGS
jgi:3-hydroxyisobutyrate dehydrogenase-like beta-hydroxyacid dehydrogenase